MEKAKVSEKKIAIFGKQAPGLLVKIDEFEIINDESRQDIIVLGKMYQENVKLVKEYFKEDIERADKLHKSLTGKRKVLVDHYSVAVKAIKDKIGTYDKKVIEDKRQIELKRQAEEQKKHARLIESARKKTEKLLEGVQDNEQQILILSHELDLPECTDEEATVIRGQIAVLETAIANKKDKVETVVEKVEQAAPVSAPVSSAPKPTGYEVEITKPEALCRDIAEGKAPASLVSKFDIANIAKDRKRGILYSGVNYTPTYSKARL